MTLHPPSLAGEIDAALAFWRAAGVDCDFADDARAWLADPAELAVSPAPQPHGEVPGAPDLSQASEIASAHRDHAATAAPASARRDFWGDSPPASLDDFRNWWLTSPDLGAGSYPRIAPRGQAGARLMVLVPDPESTDETQLLGGPQGRLLANILAAMGLAVQDCYIASALPRHTPMADLAGLATSGLDRVTAHHIALAAPQQLIAFGQGLAPLVTATGEAKERPLREINQNGVNHRVMVTETLGSMLDMPRLKARFWRRWMEMSA